MCTHLMSESLIASKNYSLHLLLHAAAFLDFEAGGGEVPLNFWVEIPTRGRYFQRLRYNGMWPFILEHSTKHLKQMVFYNTGLKVL